MELVEMSDYPRKRRKVWPWVLLVLALAFMTIVLASMSNADISAKFGTGSNPVAVATATSKTGSAPSSKTPSGPKTTVGEGTWKVGTDVAAGEYKTDGAQGGVIQMCYWDTRKTTSNDTIQDQGVSSGTNQPGRVTLKAGQYFQTSGCENWVKQ